MQPTKRGTGSLEEEKAWDKYFDYLIRMLADPDASARLRAARLLGENREPRAVTALTGLLLDDPDMSVRESAAAALGQLGAVEALVGALHVPNVHVRQLVTQALGQIRDPRAVPPLVESLHDARAEVRQQVAFALTKIGPPALDLLLPALRHSDPYIRWSIVRVLGTIGDRRALPELDRLAAEDHAEVMPTGLVDEPSALTRPHGTVAIAARQVAEKIRRGSAHTGALRER